MTLSSTESAGKGRTIWKVLDAAPADAVGGKPVDTAAVERDRTAVGRGCPRDHVEQGRLAGAVRANDREDRALLDRKTNPIDRNKAAELFADIVD